MHARETRARPRRRTLLFACPQRGEFRDSSQVRTRGGGGQARPRTDFRGACEAPRPEAGAGGNDLDGTTMRPAQTMKRSITEKLQPNIERRTTPSFSDVRGPWGPGHERIGPVGRNEMCALATSMHVLNPAPARPRPGRAAQPEARPVAKRRAPRRNFVRRHVPTKD